MPAKNTTTTLQWWMPREAAAAPTRDPPGVINVRVAELRKPGRCGGRARTYQTLVEWLAASPDHVYCGRRVHHVEGTFNSPFRNDVPKVNLMSQDGAVSAFEQRFRQKLSQDPELIEKLVGLRDKTLGCWCKPKSCHCDILLKLADEYSGVLHPPEPPRTSGVLHPPEPPRTSGVSHPPEPPRTSGVSHPPESPLSCPAGSTSSGQATETTTTEEWDDWEPEEWMDGYDDDGPLTNAGPMVRGNRGAAGSARGGGGGRKRVDGKGSVYSAKHARKVAGQH